MLLLAFASEELEIVGVTTVAGNVPLDKTTRNARIIAELAGRDDVRIFAGAAEPLKRQLVTAEYVHGREGIDGAEIFEPARAVEEQSAVAFIIEQARKRQDDSLVLVPTGPLTNIAMAIHKAPDITAKIRSIVLMGGAFREGGNVTPCAEFNIFVDPHAADIVFRCGRPIVAMGLDVTHQVLSTQRRRQAIGAIGSRVARNVENMLDFYNRHDSEKYGTDGGPLHDPCTIAYLLRADLFETKMANVTVETSSELTMGQTVVDYWGVTDRAPNAQWAHGVDAEGFYELLTERIGRL